MGRAWFAAPLLAVALLVVSAASASAADEGDAPMVVSADRSGSLGLVSTAQSDVESDPEDGTDRRLVGRESSERVDAIVIALWSIAAGMTVMLGIFLWHTSPRRRLRLARHRSTQLYEADGEESEDGSAEERPADDGSAQEGSVDPEHELAEEGSVDPEQESAEEGSVDPEQESAEEGSVDPEQESAEEGSVDPEQESAEEGSVDPEHESAEEGSVDPEQESAEEGSVDPEQESAEDGSDGRTSLWMLARQAGTRAIRWMGS